MTQVGDKAPHTAAGPATEETDDVLVTRYQGGDVAAFDALYARHRGPLFRYFRRQVDDASANDLYQEVWMKFINHADSYEPRGRFQAYLFTLAHNVLMDFYRRQPSAQLVDPTKEGTPLTMTEDPTGDPAQQVDAATMHARLHDEVRRLPLHQRTAWLIRQETGMSLKQIADVTQTSLEGVRSRLRYANDKLKAGMARYV